ncbi:hemolysin [Bhargavaea cecembensis]|uniref:Hemolysin n=1 Tax=Bhargavaea cecembensis TaxID=394098 RepID=A0A161RJR0_9BACL|nr:CNNM domain-containing protein [Bhargavaea cecembensis]KZE38498.1 hemolysin [Bhargavaea cecembensis]
MFIVLGILLFLSFFFSGSETALTATNRMKVQLRADQGDRKSEKLLKLISKPDRMITSILIGNNIVNILMPTLLTAIAIDKGWQVGLATTILTITLIIFGEVLPKTIAATFSERVAYLVFPIIRFLVIILSPLTYLLSLFTNIFIRIISRGTVTEATLTKEDLRSMVDIASTEGTFEEEESIRLKGVMDFPEKDVSDVMSAHRTEIVGVPLDATYEYVRDTILEHWYTRYPVYEDNMDTIVGVFYSKQLIEWSMATDSTIEDYMDREPLFVVESLSVERVFKMMLAKKKHIAIVLDEYGGTLGIVTHEDIIEEMIGQDIEDETDQEDEVLVYEMTDTRLECSGRLEMDDLKESFRSEMPDEHETVGGFVLQQLGHVPVPGDQFTYGNLDVIIEEMDRNRITRMLITKREHEEAEQAATSEEE